MIPVDVAAEVAPPSRGPDVDGRYLFVTRLASYARVPVIGRIRSVTVTRSVAEVVRDGDGWSLVQLEVCSVEIEGGTSFTRTHVPEAFLAAVPATRAPMVVVGDGDGWRVHADLGVASVGYDGSADASLPASVDDPRVYDWDGDGRPGATIEVSITGVGRHAIDVVQRARVVLDGFVGRDGTLEGGARTPLLESVVLVADHPFLRQMPEVIPDDAASSFSLVPVAAGAGCADHASRSTSTSTM